MKDIDGRGRRFVKDIDWRGRKFVKKMQIRDNFFFGKRTQKILCLPSAEANVRSRGGNPSASIFHRRTSKSSKRQSPCQWIERELCALIKAVRLSERTAAPF